jgi:hypothetical protein
MAQPPSRRNRTMGRRGIAILAVAGFFTFAGAAGAQAATLTVAKRTNPAGDPTAFTFHVAFKPIPGDTPPAGFKPPADFQLAGGQSRTFTVHKGFYTVTEQTAAGWTLADITCDNDNDPDPADAPKIDVARRTATLEISTPEHKGCTFTNTTTVVPPPGTPPGGTPPGGTPPGTTPPGTTPPGEQGTAPGQTVAGVQVARSSARLVAPERCVSRRFTVRVTAGRVASVAVFVNGRRVRTLAARTGQRRFSFVLPRPLRVARVVVRVTFRAGTAPATRTLRATVRRCAPQAIRPQFTG